MCPRCKGRLRKESDSFGAYETCMFCGYCSDRDDVPSEILASTLSMKDDGTIRLRRKEPRMAGS